MEHNGVNKETRSDKQHSNCNRLTSTRAASGRPRQLMSNTKALKPEPLVHKVPSEHAPEHRTRERLVRHGRTREREREQNPDQSKASQNCVKKLELNNNQSNW